MGLREVGEVVNKYKCNLGVLCSVARIKRWENGFKYKGRHMETRLIDSALSDFGITETQQNKLIDMNDEYGADFNQIADWVEEKM